MISHNDAMIMSDNDMATDAGDKNNEDFYC